MKALMLPAALLALAAPALAQEERAVTMDEVPPTVMEAALAETRGAADFTEVALDDGVREPSGSTDEGTGHEADVMEDGTTEEVEREIAQGDPPAAVAATLEAELAGLTTDEDAAG